MISNLTPEDRDAWNRQMTRYARRQKRQMRLEVVKRIAALVVLVACLIVTVWTVWPGKAPKAKVLRADSLIDEDSSSSFSMQVADSSHQGHINPEIQREYDSLVRAEGHKEDSTHE